VKQIGIFTVMVVSLQREKRPRGENERILQKLEKLIVMRVTNITRTKEWAIVFNQFPILPVHLLLFPIKNKKFERREQKIERRDLSIIGITKILGPESRIFFNGIGAGATLNSIHFQCIFRKLPIEDISLNEYPASVIEEPASSENRLWKRIQNLQENGIPFNLLITPKRTFIFPRKKEKSNLFPRDI